MGRYHEALSKWNKDKGINKNRLSCRPIRGSASWKKFRQDYMAKTSTPKDIKDTVTFRKKKKKKHSKNKHGTKKLYTRKVVDSL